MQAPNRGATRIARAASFGVATLALACGAHLSAGGELPSMTVLGVLALPLVVAAAILTRRRCGRGLLLVSLAVAQVLLHEALMRFASHVPGGAVHAAIDGQYGVHSMMSGPMSTHSASAMNGAMGGATLSGADGWTAMMTAAHVVATIVTALLLARGEQALWQLVTRLLPTLPCLPRLLSCGPRQSIVLLSVPALRPCLASGGSGLRGPPAGFVATA
jgi:hypothetical protein